MTTFTLIALKMALPSATNTEDDIFKLSVCQDVHHMHTFVLLMISHVCQKHTYTALGQPVTTVWHHQMVP